MVNIRAQKVANVATTIPEQEVNGPEEGKLLVLSWGGTYGACTTAVNNVRHRGGSVAHAHLRYMNPFPSNLGELLGRYETVLIPELNRGQLRMLVRSEFLIDAVGLNKVQGRPFAVYELENKIEQLLKGRQAVASTA
jgi:2-oxoglutarate ferredoxin oxidoreductase subunit alpha